MSLQFLVAFVLSLFFLRLFLFWYPGKAGNLDCVIFCVFPLTYFSKFQDLEPLKENATFAQTVSKMVAIDKPYMLMQA